jgi:hypothetical protein
VIADEAAFWYTEEFSTNADVEILNAVRPGLSTTSGPMIIASSPYGRRGVLWEAHRNHFGKNGDPKILVARGATRDFNPSLPQSVIDRALERDRAAASAEYLAEFRSDIESFVTYEVVRACLGDYVEAAPFADHRYFAFVDPSGGSADSFTMAIGHKEGERIFIDATREIQPPFSPEAVIDEFAALLKCYRISKASGIVMPASFPVSNSESAASNTDAQIKPSPICFAMCFHCSIARIVLPKSERLVNQLCGLERRVSKGGRDSIDHAPSSKDDLANAVAGAADLASGRRENPHAVFGFYSSQGNQNRQRSTGSL